MTFVTSSGRRGRESAALALNLPMRGTIEGLPSPRPIGEQLPAAFQEDDFCQRMMSALDEVLAPVFTTLDCFDSYIDADLAPADFVDWLGSWVGLDLDETWTVERRRQLIQAAVGLYRVRGTVAGLSAHIELYSGIVPEVQDSGGCIWSQTANNELPGSPDPRLTVRLRVEDAESLRRSTVARIIDASRPAHVPYNLEILVGGTEVGGTEAEAPEAAPAGAPGAVVLPGSEHIELAPPAPPSDEDIDTADELPGGEDEQGH